MKKYEKVKTNWILDDVFYKSITDPNIQKDIDLAIEKTNEFCSKYQNGDVKISKLTKSEFLNYLEETKDSNFSLIKVYLYFARLSSLDTQNQEVLKKLSELSNTFTILGEKTLFVSEEYKEIGYDKLMEMSSSKIFAQYKNYLANIANNLKYDLSDKEESVAMKYGNVLGGFVDIYDELTNQFTFKIGKKEYTKAEVYEMRSNTNPEIRKQGWDLMNAKYFMKENQIVLGNIYKSVCKSNVSNMNIRGMENVMDSRNISEEMDNDTVQILLDKVSSNYNIYQDFLKLKAKILGKEKLDYYDILAPINTKKGKKIPFEKGLDIYLKNIKKFDKEFYDISLEMFETGKIDVFPTKNKRDGAYSASYKNVKSYILLNYTDSLRDVSTLAHELGHSIHGTLSQKCNEYSYAVSLCLAETASIFNETLLMNDLVDKEKNTEKKNILIMKYLDDIFSTMFRQIMYVSFEKRCHTAFLENTELTYEDFNTIWMEECEKLYGDAVNLTPDMACGWSIIPHIFHTPFYCYTYSFGNIISFSLYQQYIESDNKKSFVKKYKNILAAGGSKRPKELLLENDIDICSDAFYESAFSVIKEYINKVKI